jgi:hypothetical protein
LAVGRRQMLDVSAEVPPNGCRAILNHFAPSYAIAEAAEDKPLRGGCP